MLNKVNFAPLIFYRHIGKIKQSILCFKQYQLSGTLAYSYFRYFHIFISIISIIFIYKNQKYYRYDYHKVFHSFFICFAPLFIIIKYLYKLNKYPFNYHKFKATLYFKFFKFWLHQFLWQLLLLPFDTFSTTDLLKASGSTYSGDNSSHHICYGIGSCNFHFFIYFFCSQHLKLLKSLGRQEHYLLGLENHNVLYLL